MTGYTICILPGCGGRVPIAQPGRPPRRYCSADHHALGRILAMPDDEGELDAADPGTIASRPSRYRALQLTLDPVTTLPAISRPGRHRHGRAFTEQTFRATDRHSLPRRLTVGIAAGVMAATAMFWTPMPGPPGSGIGTPWSAIAGRDEEDWAAEARRAVTSYEDQIREIDEANRVWETTSAGRAGRTTPAAVQAMLARRAALEHRQSTLSAALTARDALEQSRRELAMLRDRVAALRDTVRSGTGTAPRDELAAAETSLDTIQAEVDRLTRTVADAVATPIPDDGDTTAAVTAAVLALVHGTVGPAGAVAPADPLAAADPQSTADDSRTTPITASIGVALAATSNDLASASPLTPEVTATSSIGMTTPTPSTSSTATPTTRTATAPFTTPTVAAAPTPMPTTVPTPTYSEPRFATATNSTPASRWAGDPAYTRLQGWSAPGGFHDPRR